MNAEPLFRRRILISLAILMIGAYAAISLRSASSAAARLAQASRDLDEVSEKLNEIARLQQSPKVAALQLESPAEITNRIAAALKVADLSESYLMKEQPSDPQRLQRTDFELRATVIELAPQTLPKILRFCEALRDPETGTLVRDLTLSIPQNAANSGNEEKWGAQLVLTQLIFSPKSR